MTSIRRNRGQGLVEYALLIPVFLLMIMIIVDLGRITYTYATLYNATREGNRYGVVNPLDFPGIINTTRDFAIGLDHDPGVLQIWVSKPDDFTIRVRATYDFSTSTPILPMLIGVDEFTLESESEMRIE